MTKETEDIQETEPKRGRGRPPKEAEPSFTRDQTKELIKDALASQAKEFEDKIQAQQKAYKKEIAEALEKAGKKEEDDYEDINIIVTRKQVDEFLDPVNVRPDDEAYCVQFLQDPQSRNRVNRIPLFADSTEQRVMTAGGNDLVNTRPSLTLELDWPIHAIMTDGPYLVQSGMLSKLRNVVVTESSGWVSRYRSRRSASSRV